MCFISTSCSVVLWLCGAAQSHVVTCSCSLSHRKLYRELTQFYIIIKYWIQTLSSVRFTGRFCFFLHPIHSGSNACVKYHMPINNKGSVQLDLAWIYFIAVNVVRCIIIVKWHRHPHNYYNMNIVTLQWNLWQNKTWNRLLRFKVVIEIGKK